MHRLIWHQVPIPEGRTFDVEAKDVHFKSMFEPTSLMMSLLAWAFQNTKRPTDVRQSSLQLVRAFVDSLCAGPGMQLKVRVLRSNAAPVLRNLHLTSPETHELWDPTFFAECLSFAWAADQSDLNKPWITSPGARPHVVDWLAFCLDKPARLQKTNKRVYNIKTQLASGALEVLSQIAAALDARASELTVRISDFKEMSRRVDPLARWTLVGAATELLLKQEDP